MDWCCCTTEAGAVEYCGDPHPRFATGTTSERTEARSHSAAVGPAKTSQSLSTSFTDPTLLRGCCLPLLLRGCGRHLLSPQVAEEEKAKLLRDSHIVPKLDVFITHSWRDSGLAKYLCLLLYCNGLRAAALSVGAGVAACMLVIAGALPLWPITYSPWPSLVGLPLFYLGLLFLHLAPRWLGGGQGCYFLDKLCIDQCDPARKRAGIESLAAFIAASDRLLLMWSPTYFTRLWCTVEVATFLHVRAQVPGGLSLRRSLAFRPLQLPTLTVAAMAAIQLGMLSFQPRYFLKLSPLGYVVAYLIAAFFPIGMNLAVVHKARVLAHDREDLESRLADFRIEGADCSLDSDRDIVYATVEGFFGSLDGFNQLMRGRFKEEVLAALPGSNGVPVDFLVFILLPFMFPALDWTAYNVIAYRSDGDWKALVSHTVHMFSAMPNAWLVADVIFRFTHTRFARALWRPGAARNMMVSAVIAVLVTGLSLAQFGVAAILRWRHPVFSITHCLLTCGVLLIARRCRWC